MVSVTGVRRRHRCDGADGANGGHVDHGAVPVAQGVLVALRGYGVDDAFGELLGVGYRHHLEVHAVATSLVKLAAGHAPSDRADAVVDAHWGALLGGAE